MWDTDEIFIIKQIQNSNRETVFVLRLLGIKTSFEGGNIKLLPCRF